MSGDAFWAERDARRAAAQARFDRLCAGFLHLGKAGHNRIGARLEAALSALRGYRDAHNQDRNVGNGETILAARVVADELAAQIQESAGPGQDPATIAWVLAGLRCPNQPFCTGCQGCFTITSPHRPVPGLTPEGVSP